MEEQLSLRGKLINAVIQDFYRNTLGNHTLGYVLTQHLNFDTKVVDIIRKDGGITVTIKYEDEEIPCKILTIKVEKI